MTVEFKTRIAEAVNEWVQPGNNDRSQNALASKSGVSAGTISLIKNYKFENNGSPVGMEHFLHLAKFLGIAPDADGEMATTPVLHWQTANYVRIHHVCAMAQRQNRHILLNGDSGSGKTYALEAFAKNDRVMYLRCKSIMNMKDLLQDIMKGLKITTQTKRPTQWMDEIESKLVAQPGWLLILDETEDLPDGIWRAIKEIMDSFRGRCGLVVAGIELNLKLEAKAAKAKAGYRQLKRRLFPNQVHLNRVGRNQIKEVLEQMGLPSQNGLMGWLATHVSDYQMLNQYLADALKMANGDPLTPALMDEFFNL